MPFKDFDNLPDILDGLTRKERIVLFCLKETQKELGGKGAATAMLYGRVLEHVDITQSELQFTLQKLIGTLTDLIHRPARPIDAT